MAGKSPKNNSVLIVVNTNLRRGAEVFAEQLHDGLIDEGWYAAVVSLTSAQSGAVTSAVPLTDIEPASAGRFSWRIQRSLRRQIYEANPDVVLAMGGSTLRYCVMAARRAPGSLVYLGIGEATYWIRSTSSRLVNRFLLRRPDRILAVSLDSLGKILEVEPKVAENSHVAYIGVPGELFAIEKTPRGERLRVLV